MHGLLEVESVYESQRRDRDVLGQSAVILPLQIWIPHCEFINQFNG